jgi:hypothetical protein
VDSTNIVTFKDPWSPKGKPEAAGQKADSAKHAKPDWLATVTLTYSFFAFLFNYVLVETILTPMAMDQVSFLALHEYVEFQLAEILNDGRQKAEMGKRTQ